MIGVKPGPWFGEKRMTPEQVLKILELTCGEPTAKEDFLYHVGEALKTGEHLEYRFMGHLGFGGKIWLNRGKAPYVTCYGEDETAGRKILIEAANLELENLFSETKG